MPELPHLPLRRVQYEAPRKKVGFGAVSERDFRRHGEVLKGQVENVIQSATRPITRGIDPNLVLRVTVAGHIDEEQWKRLNLTLVGQNQERTLVLFSSDIELRKFRQQLDTYHGGPPQGQKHPPHVSVFGNIKEISRLQPVDRIGRLLRATGVTELAHFSDSAIYTLDLELWHTGSTQECQTRLNQIRSNIESSGGRVTDTYVGSSLVIARIKALGGVVRDLLTFDIVANIDLPPAVSLRVAQQLGTSLQDLAVTAPADDAPGICTLDSGVNTGHPLLAGVIGEATAVPAQLGDASDAHGHGTMVAGLGIYGDIQVCIQEGQFHPQLRLFSARVLNADNQFDDENLITTQMRQAIEYFKNTYGCKVFNASLGDRRTPFNGGKVTPWASILDHLSRELDIVIVVSAGNYDHEPPSGDHDHHLHGYPGYLLEPPAKIIEPATGCIVLTVGSFASSANVPRGAAGEASLQPIARAGQPSPFTRSGPGIGGAIKPDLCEYGGNTALNGLLRRTQTPAESAIISLNRQHLQQLFTTDSGTSFAAPIVAHNAARLYARYPDASANLIRALLASSAMVPRPARELLETISERAVLEVCGYGVPSLARASVSAPNRVFQWAEGSLPADCFHIYEVPIPEEIYQGRGTRSISVTLAFDPPVRHSRLDYLGTTMSYRLIRGKTLEEVEEAFRRRTQQEPQVERIDAPHNCLLEPMPTLREGSTLQKATFTMRRAPRNYGETYFLVVRCHRGWAIDEHFPQRYAVVVSMEHEEQVDLYVKMQARLQLPVRLRA